MPRSSAKPVAQTAKNKKRSTISKDHETSAPTRVHSVAIANTRQQRPVVVQEPRLAAENQQTRTQSVHDSKYHETISFLEQESFKGLAPTDKLQLNRCLDSTMGESYRVASTMFQAAHQASQETRPVSWGYGFTDGALGHNNTRRIVEMKHVESFRSSIVRAVSAGNRLSLFLTDDHRIFQSGRLFIKQDGCSMWKPIEVKMKCKEHELNPATFVAVEAGHLAAYALDDQGHLYSWGSQLFGQLGHGEKLDPDRNEEADADTSLEGDNSNASSEELNEEDEDNKPSSLAVVVEKTPRLMDNLVDHSIVKISAGNHFAIAVSTTGAVFSWGRGCFGQLGNGKLADVSAPVQIKALRNYIAIDVAAGMDHILGVFVPRDEANGPRALDQCQDISEHTIVMVWGRGKHGCLGLGGAKSEPTPRENVFFRGLGASKVAAGADHSMVLCRAGTKSFLYAFGGNELGQLGLASKATHVDMPSFVEEFLNVHVVQIGAGVQYSAALTGNGEVFTWGDARYGKTCRTDHRTTFVPWPVDLPNTFPHSSFITQLSIGSYHSLAQLRMHGKVDRWRKFPLGGIVTAINYNQNEDKGTVYNYTRTQAIRTKQTCAFKYRGVNATAHKLRHDVSSAFSCNVRLATYLLFAACAVIDVTKVTCFIL